jgi:hypothetical protein
MTKIKMNNVTPLTPLTPVKNGGVSGRGVMCFVNENTILLMADTPDTLKKYLYIRVGDGVWSVQYGVEDVRTNGPRKGVLPLYKQFRGNRGNRVSTFISC